jgi:GGDEF domain-containing protein
VVAQRAVLEDPLTGVGNRRALDEALRSVSAEAAAGSCDVPVSLLVVDLDDFKRINDTYGHVVGDEVLRAVAMAVRGVARADDVVARLGGDEFVVLARGADPDTGRPCWPRPTRRCTTRRPAAGAGEAQASTTTGMIIGRRRCLLETHRPTTRRIVCWSW